MKPEDLIGSKVVKVTYMNWNFPFLNAVILEKDGKLFTLIAEGEEVSGIEINEGIPDWV